MNTNKLYNLYILNKNLNNRVSVSYETLKIGMSGESVLILQDKLKILSYYFGTITSNFDKNTENSVIEFQKSNNLSITGVVNNQTWELLYAKTAPPETFSTQPTLRFGDKNNDVKILQKKLQILLYYYGNITGIFDKNTDITVKQFQLNNSLTPDGIVGNNTWSKLNILYEPLTNCNTLVANEYIVAKGDTLYSIALSLGFTVEKLKQLNNLTSDVIQVGQILKINDDSSNNGSNFINYTVQKGDTLYAIANNFNTSIEELKKVNNLLSNLISVGQVLKIVSNIPTYIVAKGDTLYSIAKKYGTTVEAIKQSNNLTSNIISIGQPLLLGSL